METLQHFAGLTRRCIEDYNMITAGDTVAVGISGGKDSLLTLAILRELQQYFPRHFTLRAITVDCGFPSMDFAPVAVWCAEIGVPYTITKAPIRQIVFDIRQEQNPCSLCSKLRKGALNNAAKSLGCNKLALGHHRDDAVNTFLMSLIFEGRISCFEPVTYMDRSGITQIRPLLYAKEWQTASLAQTLKLPVVKSTCPMDKASKRREIQQLAADLQHQYPGLQDRIFGAMQRLPLPGWQPNDGH